MGMLMWAIVFVPIMIALVLASVNPSSVRTLGYVLLFGVTIVSGLGLLYYFYGWLFLCRRRRRPNPQCHGGAQPRSIPLISTTKKL